MCMLGDEVSKDNLASSQKSSVHHHLCSYQLTSGKEKMAWRKYRVVKSIQLLAVATTLLQLVTKETFTVGVSQGMDRLAMEKR